MQSHSADEHGIAIGRVPQLVRLVHKHFLWFLVGSYAVAGFFPSAGLWVKDVSLGQMPLTQAKVSLK